MGENSVVYYHGRKCCINLVHVVPVPKYIRYSHPKTSDNL